MNFDPHIQVGLGTLFHPQRLWKDHSQHLWLLGMKGLASRLSISWKTDSESSEAEVSSGIVLAIGFQEPLSLSNVGHTDELCQEHEQVPRKPTSFASSQHK